MIRSLLRACLGVASLVALPTFAADKLAVPSPEVEAQTAKMVADLYRKEYAEAKTVAQKLALAKMLVQVATDTKDDPAAKYVLLRVAKDIAVGIGDADLALQIVAAMDKAFAVRGGQLKAAALDKILTTTTKADDKKSLLLKLETVAEECLAADDFDTSVRLFTKVSTLAAEVRDQQARQRVTLRLFEIDLIKEAFTEVPPALERLAAQPDDPQANLVVGRYQCFHKNDWARGLPALARCGDTALQALAHEELALNPDGLKLGDGWWGIADKEIGSAAQKVRAHAANWYRQALPMLSGIAKVRVEKLLAQVPEEKRSGIIRYYSEALAGFDNAAKAQELVLEAGIGDGSRPTKDKNYGYAFAGVEFAGARRLTLSRLESSAGFRHFDAQSFAGFFIDYRTSSGYSHRVALALGSSDKSRFSKQPTWGAGIVPTRIIPIAVKQGQKLDLDTWAPEGWDGAAIFTVVVQNTGPSTFIRTLVALDLEGETKIQPPPKKAPKRLTEIQILRNGGWVRTPVTYEGKRVLVTRLDGTKAELFSQGTVLFWQTTGGARFEVNAATNKANTGETVRFVYEEFLTP